MLKPSPVFNETVHAWGSAINTLAVGIISNTFNIEERVPLSYRENALYVHEKLVDSTRGYNAAYEVIAVERLTIGRTNRDGNVL